MSSNKSLKKEERLRRERLLWLLTRQSQGDFHRRYVKIAGLRRCFAIFVMEKRRTQKVERTWAKLRCVFKRPSEQYHIWPHWKSGRENFYKACIFLLTLPQNKVLCKKIAKFVHCSAFVLHGKPFFQGQPWGCAIRLGKTDFWSRTNMIFFDVIEPHCCRVRSMKTCHAGFTSKRYSNLFLVPITNVLTNSTPLHSIPHGERCRVHWTWY